VEGKTIRNIAIIALVAVGIAFIPGGSGTAELALAILGLTRSADTRRDGRRIESVAYGALAAFGLAVSATAVVFGIILMTSK